MKVCPVWSGAFNRKTDCDINCIFRKEDFNTKEFDVKLYVRCKMAGNEIVKVVKKGIYDEM